MLHTCCHKLLNIIVVLLQNYSLLWICCNASIKLVVTKNWHKIYPVFTLPLYFFTIQGCVWPKKWIFILHLYKTFLKITNMISFQSLEWISSRQKWNLFFCKRELSATFFFMKDQVKSEWWSTCVLLWEYFVGVCFYWFLIMCFRAYSATWMIVWAKMLHSEWISGENCNLEHHKTYQWWQ